MEHLLVAMVHLLVAMVHLLVAMVHLHPMHLLLVLMVHRRVVTVHHHQMPLLLVGTVHLQVNIIRHLVKVANTHLLQVLHRLVSIQLFVMRCYIWFYLFVGQRHQDI